VHAPVFCHVPSLPQICGCCPLHRVAPGAQTPWHVPLTHAWFEQAAPLLFHVPVLSHVCGC
jgi:hypothetical protein